jgi:hypothetical protein
MFPDGTDGTDVSADTDPTDIKFRTLGLIDGDERLAKDLGAVAKQKAFK